MDLINDLEIDLAFAFLVEKRFCEKIDSNDAAKLIRRIRSLLEATPLTRSAAKPRALLEHIQKLSAH